MKKQRAFLKWAGGKYGLIESITQFLPTGKVLVEPFVGAGSVFLNTDYEAYTYFFALGYQPSKKHNLQFMITSSPQWHDQDLMHQLSQIILNIIQIMMVPLTDNTIRILDIVQMKMVIE